MSYRRPPLGTLEIDLSGRRRYPYYPPPPQHIVHSEATEAQQWAGLAVAALFIGVFAYAIYKAPKGAWTRSRRYYDDRPDVRVRLNRRRKRRRRNRR